MELEENFENDLLPLITLLFSSPSPLIQESAMANELTISTANSGSAASPTLPLLTSALVDAAEMTLIPELDAFPELTTELGRWLALLPRRLITQVFTTSPKATKSENWSLHAMRVGTSSRSVHPLGACERIY